MPLDSKMSVVWSLELEISLLFQKLSCLILIYCYFFNIKLILLVKRRSVLIHITNLYDKRLLGVEKGVIPLDQSSSLTASSYDVSPPPRRGGSPRRSAHPQTRCIFTPPNFSLPLLRRSPIGCFNPAIPTRIFPHCSPHIWPHMTSHRQSKLSWQFARSQFSAMATFIWNPIKSSTIVLNTY